MPDRALLDSAVADFRARHGLPTPKRMDITSRLDAQWKEEEHPRDEKGQFTEIDAVSKTPGTKKNPTGERQPVHYGKLTDEGRAKLDEQLAEHGITIAKLKGSVDSAFAGATPFQIAQGKAWYGQAHDHLVSMADEYGVTPEQAVAIAAAMSPNNKWPDQLDEERRVLDAARKNPEALAALPADVLAGLLRRGNTEAGNRGFLATGDSITKAFSILKGEPVGDVLSGAKVRSFYQNLAFPGATDDVTIDTHIAKLFIQYGITKKDKAQQLLYRAARGPHGNGGAGYTALAEAIRKSAREHGISPDAMQATTWLVLKDRRWPRAGKDLVVPVLGGTE